MSKEQTPVSSGELMIGNWVACKCLDELATTIRAIDRRHLRLDCNHMAHYSFLEVSGIPLTPEILEKCGFVKDSKGDYWKDLQTHYLLFNERNDGFYPQYAGLPEMSSESEQIVSLHRINYVHELQNLYKILTGTHLTINL